MQEYDMNHFVIIVFSSIVLIGGGIIGYKFYQNDKLDAAVKAQEQAEKEALQKEFGNAELKVTSAEMNPIQENVDAAEEAVHVLPDRDEKQELLERVMAIKEEIKRIQEEEEEARLAALSNQIDQAKINLGISGSLNDE